MTLLNHIIKQSEARKPRLFVIFKSVGIFKNSISLFNDFYLEFLATLCDNVFLFSFFFVIFHYVSLIH